MVVTAVEEGGAVGLGEGMTGEEAAERMVAKVVDVGAEEDVEIMVDLAIAVGGCRDGGGCGCCASSVVAEEDDATGAPVDRATAALEELTIDWRFCKVRTPVDDETATMVLPGALLPMIVDAEEAGGVGVAPRDMVMGEAPRLSVNTGVVACVLGMESIDTGICCSAIEIGCDADWGTGCATGCIGGCCCGCSCS